MHRIQNIIGFFLSIFFKVQTKLHYFDTHWIDRKIEKFSNSIQNKYNLPTFSQSHYKYDIAFFASLLYPVGGHTKCLVNLFDSLHEKRKLACFLSNLTQSYKFSGEICNKIKEKGDMYGIDCNINAIADNIENLYNKIISTPPRIAIVYIHPDDIVFASVLSLLHKYSNIRILYFNHASHFPCLGMTFSNLVLDCLPSALEITRRKRKISHSQLISIQSTSQKDIIFYPESALNEIKKKLGIPLDSFITMSGGSSYKFFNHEKSIYFSMIKDILTNEKNLYHVMISDLSKKQINIINKIFSTSSTPNIKERLIIHPLTPNYEKLFQCADVFIDSFPVSSAMTQVDLMKNKVATVVKCNFDSPEYSFHEYLPPNYEYLCSTTEEMKKSIFYLLYNKDKRQLVIEKNYMYWLENYERDHVRDKWIKIIDGEYYEY